MDPNTQSQFPPAPASPASVLGDSNTETPGGMSQEEMKANLQAMMEKIDSKYQDFNSQKFSSDNQTQEQQSEILRQLFDLFQSQGVDPSNPEEVRAFLDKIKESNPELSQQIETALSTILGEDPMVQSESLTSDQAVQSPAPDNMNINNNDQTPQNL